MTGDLDVWRAYLDRPTVELERLKAHLSLDERERAARFHFDVHRNRFIAARGILRELLSRYTGRAPAALEFAYGAQGKPELATDAALGFNVSHSGNIALYAVARERRVGIDVERARPDVAFEEIAERFFSPAEREALAAASPARRCRAFFTCWTRKEAYIKALGGGLSVPLYRFDVSLCPHEPAGIIEDRADPRAAERWTMYNITAAVGFAAAVVVESPSGALRVRDWVGDKIEAQLSSIESERPR